MSAGAAIAGAGIDAREARLLLADVSGLSEAILISFPDRPLPEPVRERFQALVERRKRGEPVAYLLGRREFYGLDLVVGPSVLVPRPETELLVDLVRQRNPSTVLELGCGSGAISLALKRHLPAARVVAVEASEAALAVARENASRLELEIELRLGSWFAPVSQERFDLVVANPPYVAEGDPHLAELKYEPPEALVSGRDGLDAIREIVAGAPGHLAAGGWLLLEHGLGQDGAVRDLLAGAGFADIATWPDLAGIARATGGRVKS